MAPAMILIPLALAAAALALPSNRWRPLLLPIAGLIHAGLTAAVLAQPPGVGGEALLALDPPGRLVLAVISTLFLLCSIYTAGYLRVRAERNNRVFCACCMAFLGMASLVTWAQHLGLMWVGIEATTLATAPLIYFNRTQRSIEATWKYLLVCSVGIALALLGSFFLAYASLHHGMESSLMFSHLRAEAPRLSRPWLHGAFVLLLVGYGTKMGLAPMHTWKPDAYGEAPGVVGALLAGGLTSCAMLAIVRVYNICQAAGGGASGARMLVGLGLLSMTMAGLLMAGQRDVKRLLAYSSVEHMGVLVLGIGLGGGAVGGAMLHLISNAMTKGVLFLSAGNIHRAFGSKAVGEIRGAAARLPVSGMLLLLGFLAITGSPPFGIFVSELRILTAAIGGGRYLVAAAFLVLLMLVFIGMGGTILSVVRGGPSDPQPRTAYRDTLLTTGPIVAMGLIVLMMGVYIPEPIRRLVEDAARFLEPGL